MGLAPIIRTPDIMSQRDNPPTLTPYFSAGCSDNPETCRSVASHGVFFAIKLIRIYKVDDWVYN